MKAAYLDLHIHTSPDPEKPNDQYDIDLLMAKIKEYTEDSDYLISLTDHNFINKSAYLSAVRKGVNILLGAELHIEYDKSTKPYHCHIYFDVSPGDSDTIDKINRKLDKLYPKKVVSFGDPNIPHIETIITEFDELDFLLLPHGGQSHSTFDVAIPEGHRFDTTMERSIYYNQFDGFTARGDTGLERTQNYFKKLGIKDFVNLVTCTDNYDPNVYPSSKGTDASDFVPTWMNSEPTFSGLRLSLSESSRLSYGKKPKAWAEYVQTVRLKNDKIDIDVVLTPGLNVVIGGSSTGKTLFVDSVYRRILGNFEGSKYGDFGIADLYVQNPSGVVPHYIHQNYIMELVNETAGKSISDIEIIRKIFPGDQELVARVRNALIGLKTDLGTLVGTVKSIENIQNDLSRIPALPRLIISNLTIDNYFKKLLPTNAQLQSLSYPPVEQEQHLIHLEEIEAFVGKNSFVEPSSGIFEALKDILRTAAAGAKLEGRVRAAIQRNKDELDAILSSEDGEQQSKKEHREKLTSLIQQYVAELRTFDAVVKRLKEYSIVCQTQEIESMGHRLYIDNKFVLTKETLKDTFNKYLKTDLKIESLDDLIPEMLFESRFKKQSPKVQDYDDFSNRVYKDLEELNKLVYRIKTSDGKDFESLSAGWKTSILLDLILGYRGDSAPLIIDQPEDNLATRYINHGLITAIKSVKSMKQIILVSHNATIPMLGDAQNVVVCLNEEKITIASGYLEGKVAGKSVVDHIAEITDGGKPSIKKRVKKYNLKQYQE